MRVLRLQKYMYKAVKTCIVSTDDGANAAGDEPTENAITLSSDDIAEFAGPGGFGGGGNQGPNWGGGGQFKLRLS